MAEPLSSNRACDVAVIGAGITGAMAALELARAGMKVVVLDRRDGVACGSTAASTGLLQYEIDLPLVELSRRVGRHAAQRAYQLGVEAIASFESLVGELGSDCGFKRRSSLLLGTRPEDVELLKAECDARRAAGIRVDYLGAKEVSERWSFSRPAALLSYDAAEIDPYCFTTHTLARAAAMGASIFPSTEVVRYDADDSGVTLVTKNSVRVRARHVVFATGYETPVVIDTSLVSLKSTYALVTHPSGSWTGWEDRTLIWETGMPYFYARTTPDGRIMAGGEDENIVDPAPRDARLPQKTKIIARKLQTMFPAIAAPVDCAWAGTFAETKDGLPYIGPHPAFPRGQFALGYGGNGITFGLIAARLICDTLIGKANPDLGLFHFER